MHILMYMYIYICVCVCVCVCVWDFPDGSVGKESVYNAGVSGLIPRLGRSPREGNGYLLQYSWLENSMDWAAWWVTVHGVSKSQT